MSVVLSEPVGDVVAAVGKLRADDGLVTDTGQQLEEIEVLLDAITVLQSAVSDRVAEAAKVGATAEHYGRSPKRWLVEDVLIAGPEAARYVNLANWLSEFPLTRDAFASAGCPRRTRRRSARRCAGSRRNTATRSNRNWSTTRSPPARRTSPRSSKRCSTRSGWTRPPTSAANVATPNAASTSARPCTGNAPSSAR